MKLVKWLLTKQLKFSKAKSKINGFTLIELLVGLVLAVLVIAPLLGFMINVMDNDRKEQAKSASEQQIRTALDFIARDLEQAVYIYDAQGVSAISNQLPKNSATDKTNYFPVLVFWKRQYIPEGMGLIPTSSRTPVDCSNISSDSTNCDDTYTYSLVAYYLIKGDNANNIWSNTARIGRFQISDGYGATTQFRDNTRDPGFQLFNLDGQGSLQQKMNNWTKASAAYTQDILTVVDYIDHSTIATQPSCPTNFSLIPRFSASDTSLTNAVADNNLKTGSFYVCVDSSPERTVAEVFIRGNALARIERNAERILYNPNDEAKKSYFPQASIRAKGRGFLFTK